MGVGELITFGRGFDNDLLLQIVFILRKLNPLILARL
jgi:hypothetical protein